MKDLPFWDLFRSDIKMTKVSSKQLRDKWLLMHRNKEKNCAFKAQYNRKYNSEMSEEALAAKEKRHIADICTEEWHDWNVSEVLEPIIRALLKIATDLMCRPFACQVGMKNKFLTHEAHEAPSAARGVGPSAYVLRHGGGSFSREFWVAQRIAVAEIGAITGDAWWRRAEKAAIEYLWDLGYDTCNKQKGGAGGSTKTGAVWVECFDHAKFHEIFQRRCEYEAEKAMW